MSEEDYLSDTLKGLIKAVLIIYHTGVDTYGNIVYDIPNRVAIDTLREAEAFIADLPGHIKYTIQKETKEEYILRKQ